MTQQETKRAGTTTSKRSRWLWFVGLWLAGTVALLLAAIYCAALCPPWA